MHKLKNILTLCGVLLLTVSAFAQNRDTEKAEKYFGQEAYLSALESYREAYVGETNMAEKARIVFQIAECFRKMNDLSTAKTWYERSIKMKHSNAKQHLYLAMALMREGDYLAAKDAVDEYLNAEPGDATGKNIRKSCDMAPRMIANPEKWEISHIKEINSEADDFAPAFLDKKNAVVMFTSSRMGSSGDNVDERSGENFQDLWTATLDRKGGWSEASLLTVINTEDAHEGSAKMSYKRNKVYYTQCPYDKKEKIGCSIFEADMIGGQLRNVIQLNDLKLGKGDSISVGHPCLNKKGNVMVYSAELPSGRGGKDLYVTVYDKKAKQWSTPKNLGPKINTAGDEVYPFIHADGQLYFASNGHVGIGGLDIYKAAAIGIDRWSEPENVGAPLNSSADDFGIIFNKTKPEGYFSSNRKGGKGKDDIYSFLMPDPLFVLEGTILDSESKKAITGMTVTVKDPLGISFSAQTDASGKYRFAEKGNGRYIVKDKDYIVEVSKSGYLIAQDQFSTKGFEDDKTFLKDFVVVPAKVNKAFPMPEVQYEFNSFALKPSSKDSLNYLYNIMERNPNIVVELQAHTDSRGDDVFNLELSQKRAQACVDYLKSKGIQAERLKAKGFGESKPKIAQEQIDAMASEAEQEKAYQKNRRTEFTILKTDFGSASSGSK